MNFSQMGLATAQVRACESLGYTNPTPIQTKSIPIILTGQDLIGCAETGTGKTAAFLLPIIQKISEKPRPGVRVLVLAPTRELALQIEKNYTELNSEKSNRSVIVMGGTNIRTQIADLFKKHSLCRKWAIHLHRRHVFRFQICTSNDAETASALRGDVVNPSCKIGSSVEPHDHVSNPFPPERIRTLRAGSTV